MGVALLLLSSAAGCALSPGSIADDRLRFNELVKTTAEQQLLLNIVRMRYVDTPSSLAISNIAMQTELVRSIGLVPFLGVVGSEQLQSVARALPQAQVSIADRPTVTLTPLDDADFTRKLFTPMTLEGVLYLAKTTWPISTVFRLWLENLNGVSNAQSASGPVVKGTLDYARFLSGIDALQSLQDEGLVVFGSREREEEVGGAIPADRVQARDVVAAAKEGFEYRRDAEGGTWTLVRKKQQAVMRVHPSAIGSPPMVAFAEAFRVNRGLGVYEIDVEKLDPFPANFPEGGVDRIDLETRSLMQVLYFIAKGVEVPQEHDARGLAPRTTDASGRPFDWALLLRGLFRVGSTSAAQPPPYAHVAVRYLDHWYSVDRRDADSMSTFSLILELSRLELGSKPASGPALTLPLSGR